MERCFIASESDLIGFFPGLGSRVAYQNIGGNLLNSGNEEIRLIYKEVAIAMGYGDCPEKMLIIPETLPIDKMELQGFISASFFTHNLVLMAQFKELAKQQNVNLNIIAYSGESFGIINSAVASGALSIGDGAKIANFFTPYILLASDKQNDPFSHRILNYYPEDLKAQIIVPEHYYVLALRGRHKQLVEVCSALQDEFHYTEVEQHKVYSKNQINVYVKTTIKSCFDIFMKNYPAIEVFNLKEPTLFITHSVQLSPLINGLEQFINDQNIIFRDPHTPVIANHSNKIMVKGEDIKIAILALVDQMMLSSETARLVDGFNADAIIELGICDKSIQMLRDNDVHTPAFSFSGNHADALQVMQGLRVLNRIRSSNHATEVCAGIKQWLNISRDNCEFAAYFLPKISDAIEKAASAKLEIEGTNAVTLDSIYKNSWRYRTYLQSGELVLLARQKRNILGSEADRNEIYVDLKISANDGTIRYQKTPYVFHSENTLFYFSNLEQLNNDDVFNIIQDFENAPNYSELIQFIEIKYNKGEPLLKVLQLRSVHAQHETQAIRRIIMQILVFELMKVHRPGLVRDGNIYLAAHDFIGWLACMVISEAISFECVTQLCHDYYSTLGRKISPWVVVKRFAGGLTTARIPVLSVCGRPLITNRDLEANTYRILLGDFPTQHMQVELDCHLSIITQDEMLSDLLIGKSPYQFDIILINAIQDVWRHNPKLILEQRERDAQIYLTDEYRQVSDYAIRRNLQCSTINAYIEVDEVPIRFCSGGSESMTMLIQRSPEEPVIVRKILSEALTTAKWNSDGRGVMLPPFAKAARQVDYLRGLPEHIKYFFPQVYSVIEREILAPTGRGCVGKVTCKEVIYEMSFIEGEEVSQFVQHSNISPLVISKLYEVILTFLRDNVHSENRQAVTSKTLDVSYFKKIEERLMLCRNTAPQCFGPNLLDSEKIVINGNEYFNIKSLLHIFRSHPEYLYVLEPRYHSLVMGDTNTENIKIGNILPLLEVQDLIDHNRSGEEISRALAVINAKDIQLRFLDPRAIGFQSDGANSRDDYMYDNKPWHNSIGHYDEYHNDLFTLTININAQKIPIIDIRFSENNVYQRAYGIADCAMDDINPLNDPTNIGMEKYFSHVMNALYDNTNPDSIYLRDDPYWLVRFVFMMGTHFAAMPPFHFISEFDGTIKDSIDTQSRPVAIYCEGIKWLNWALEILQGKRDHFLGVNVPPIKTIVEEAI